MITLAPPLNISCPCPECKTFLLPIPHTTSQRRKTHKMRRVGSPLIVTSFTNAPSSQQHTTIFSPCTATLPSHIKTTSQLLSPLVLNASTKVSATPHLLSPFVPKTPGPARCTFASCTSRVEVRIGGEWGNKLCKAHAGELRRCVGDMVRDWEGMGARKRGVVLCAGRGSERKVLGNRVGSEKKGVGGAMRTPVGEDMRTRRRVGGVWGLESRESKKVGGGEGEDSD
jgi:hypothetical protein